MEKALRVVSVERGFDPADFTLVAFGGAGPLHACDLAEALRMRRVLVPRHPGVLSAMGMVWADAMRDYARAVPPGITQADQLQALLTPLIELARSEMGPEAMLEPAVDMRFAGQGYELSVECDGFNAGGLDEAFRAEHHRRYGHADPNRTVELVTLRLRARVPRLKPRQESLRQGKPAADAALAEMRRVGFEKVRETPVYDRERLLPGNVISGPALVAQLDSTTLIPPGWLATVDNAANLILERR
jgi:N-methylhydantoinase A